MRCVVVAACLCPLSAGAQQQPTEWGKLPRMQLERQFAGPLQDTIIQRWRDSVDGTICYVYLPIVATHSAPTASGYVQYGASTIGSISCIAGPGAGGPSATSSRSGASRASEPTRTPPSSAVPAAPGSPPKER